MDNKERVRQLTEILNDANVPYIGAGENIEEAAKPYYFIVNGSCVYYLYYKRF